MARPRKVVFFSHHQKTYKGRLFTTALHQPPHAAHKHLSRTRTMSPGQRRSLTSSLHPQTTVHRRSPRKPHPGFDRTQAPHKGRVLARRRAPTFCRVWFRRSVVWRSGGEKGDPDFQQMCKSFFTYIHTFSRVTSNFERKLIISCRPSVSIVSFLKKRRCSKKPLSIADPDPSSKTKTTRGRVDRQHHPKERSTAQGEGGRKQHHPKGGGGGEEELLSPFGGAAVLISFLSGAAFHPSSFGCWCVSGESCATQRRGRSGSNPSLVPQKKEESSTTKKKEDGGKLDHPRGENSSTRSPPTREREDHHCPSLSLLLFFFFSFFFPSFFYVFTFYSVLQLCHRISPEIWKQRLKVRSMRFKVLKQIYRPHVIHCTVQRKTFF